MGKVLAMIMAGGAGERLQPLTRDRAKSAVPFAGKFRLVDFTLSNCINSGIRQILVLTQSMSGSLHRHIQEGWGISSSGLGDYIYSIPAQRKLGADWYQGTADAVRQNLDLIKGKGVDHVLVLSGDHVYKMDYLQMVAYHKARNAALTISAARVSQGQAANKLGVLEADQEHRVVGFEEKPKQPKTRADNQDYVLASMGIYLFEVNALRKALQGKEDDFGKEVIPRMIGRHSDVFAYDYGTENRIEDFVFEVSEGRRQRVLVDKTRDSSYWQDVGTINSYYEASMDLIGLDPLFNLYGEKWPIRTFQRPLPPSKTIMGGRAEDSIVCDGCIISGGLVRNSILSPGVVVERGALVEQAILFDDVSVEPGALVRRAIIDKDARIRTGASIGYDLEADKTRGCAISDTNIVIVPRGKEIGPA